VGSAAEAFEAIASSLPDVLVSDISMPGEDGYELIRRVRQHAPEMPALALTAYSRAEERERALAAGFHMHAAKPIKPAELIAVVAALALPTG
ncbi:MAG: response regulator, partial [Polyangiaceae bacterium]|nr:response regulator [Polyangiaceae bacterium]